MGWVENYDNESVNQVGKYKYRYHYRRVDRSVEWAIRETCWELQQKDGWTVASIADHFELDIQTVARYLRAAKFGYFGFNNPKNTITVSEVNRKIVAEREVNSERIRKKRAEALYY